MILNPFNKTEVFTSSNNVKCTITGKVRESSKKEKNYFHVKHESFYVKPITL